MILGTFILTCMQKLFSQVQIVHKLSDVTEASFRDALSMQFDSLHSALSPKLQNHLAGHYISTAEL